MTPMRAAWFMLGMLSLGLAGLGAMLPLLPTTVFLLLAAYAFARSSERWHSWLVEHRLFGPMITDWRAHGAISRGAKRAAALSMLAVFGLSLIARAPVWVLGLQALCLGGAAAFVLSRPEPPGGGGETL